MGKKGGGSTTTYQQRPLSAEEKRLIATQNEMYKQGIAVADRQDKRSEDQYRIWKENYLPMEVQMGGVADPRAEAKFNEQLDNQMPRYTEDTSGARPAYKEPAPSVPRSSGGSKGGSNNTKGGR